MSTELPRIEMKGCSPLELTQFAGGADRGLCLQIGQVNHDVYRYIRVPMASVTELTIALTAWKKSHDDKPAVEEVSVDLPDAMMPPNCRELISVMQELNNIDAKWGVQRHLDTDWFLILSEEVGEVAKELVEAPNTGELAARRAYLTRLRYELCQTAAVAVTWMKHITERLGVPEE